MKKKVEGALESVESSNLGFLPLWMLAGPPILRN